MLAVKKILVPVDFSERAIPAGRHAVELAGHFESELVFAHVIPSPPPEYVSFEGGYFAARSGPAPAETIAHLTQQLDCVAMKAGAEPAARKTIREGDPGREIAKLAAQLHSDLIVMPTHGYGPFRRFILGSVTAKVLHDSDCPVFTGAHVADSPARPVASYHRVACAVDLSDHSEKVLRWAADFAKSYAARLVLIHAAPSLEVSGFEVSGFDWRGTLIDMARKQAEELLQRLNCQAEVRIDTGDVTRIVTSAAKAANADLLVIGRSAKHGLLGRLRTNAYALIRESPCPVVSV